MSHSENQALFDGASRAILSRFGYSVLAPIVKIFMRFGWSARDFSDLARWVFVKVFYATPEFWRHGHPTAQQGAIKTGLPRPHVKRLNDIPEPQLAMFNQRQNLACRIIEAWVNDPEFHVDGEPAPLRIKHPTGPTFNRLVLKHGNGVTTYAVLGELINVGCVEVEDDVVMLLNQTYGIDFLNEDLLTIVGYSARRLGETLDHNLTHPNLDERRVQRLWWQANIPAESLDEANAFIREELIAAGRRIDSGLAKFADSTRKQGKVYYEVGIGVYAFQDVANEKSEEIQQELIKRSFK